MLTEICQYLHNWFNRKPDGSDYPKIYGVINITDGQLVTDQLADGQYYRIMGSMFNDGVHEYGTEYLTDETFTGAVWAMGVPPAVVSLAEDIDKWQTKNASIDSPSMSPYQSESFGGYSYSKASGVTASGAEAGTWQAAFASRLAPWRKI